jgi:hypothetical protein
MLDGETIDRMAREQARRARGAGVKPMLLTRAVLASIRENGRFPFPNIGHYRPRGFKLVESYFVDKSGFGEEWEPALTYRGFLARLQVGRAYAIIEEGEFQCYVGEFILTGKMPQ